MRGLMQLTGMSFGAVAVYIGCTISQYAYAHQRVNKSIENSEEILVEDALTKFQQVMKVRHGHIQRISCKYKPNEVVTKTYYSDYHKKPDYTVSPCKSSIAIDKNSEIEITYSTNKKNSVSLITKRNKKRLCTKNVTLEDSL